MVLVITRNKVKNMEKYAELATDFVEDLRKEPGCIEMNLVMNEESDDEVLFVSKWESKDKWLDHVGGPAFNKHIPKLGEFYISGTDEFFRVY